MRRRLVTLVALAAAGVLGFALGALPAAAGAGRVIETELYQPTFYEDQARFGGIVETDAGGLTFRRPCLRRKIRIYRVHAGPDEVVGQVRSRYDAHFDESYWSLHGQNDPKPGKYFAVARKRIVEVDGKRATCAPDRSPNFRVG